MQSLRPQSCERSISSLTALDSGDARASSPATTELTDKQVLLRVDSIHLQIDPVDEEILASRLLQYLAFSGMTSRLDAVAAADTTTFKWVFEEQDNDDSDVDHWLKEGEKYFWITGKAGSGKSTLLKFLMTSPKTQAALSEWAGDGTTRIISYFFWGSGKPLQKAIRGLLRACLFQFLKADRGLAPLLIASLGNGKELPHLENVITTSASDAQLQDAFMAFVDHAQTKGTKYCFFIDALGECEGKRSVLLDLLDELISRPNAKVCVTSTAWPTLQHHFRNSASLNLHSLTSGDISLYTRACLTQHAKDGVTEQHIERIVSDIITRSSGTFLWVVLVTRETCDGLAQGDSIDTILNRLQTTPPKVQDLITAMLSRGVNAQEQLNGAMDYLYLRSSACQPVDLLTFSVACLDQLRETNKDTLYSISLAEVESSIEQIAATISARTSGLLEVSYDANEPVTGQVHAAFSLMQHDVGFLHDSIAHSFGGSPSQKLALLTRLLKASYLIKFWLRGDETYRTLSVRTNQQGLRYAGLIAELSPHECLDLM